jgi:hypothetical protein
MQEIDWVELLVEEPVRLTGPAVIGPEALAVLAAIDSPELSHRTPGLNAKEAAATPKGSGGLMVRRTGLGGG